MAILIDRMIRASKLDVSLYEEVEADKGSMGQAILIVILVSLAAGIGAIGVLGIQGLIVGTILDLVGWVVWAFLTFIIGTKLLPEPETKSDLGEMLRVIGFSRSPGILLILLFIPAVNIIIAIGVTIWMFVAMVIAVRQALDYKSTWRAVGVCLIGFIVYIIFRLAANWILGPQVPV